jgi:hypothetical protein
VAIWGNWIYFSGQMNGFVVGGKTWIELIRYMRYAYIVLLGMIIYDLKSQLVYKCKYLRLYDRMIL